MRTWDRGLIVRGLLMGGVVWSLSAQGTPPTAAAPRRATGTAPLDSAGRISLLREVFTYDRGGRRDPFVSLIASGEVRPLFADLRVTGILVDPADRNSVAMLKDVSTNQLYRAKVGSVFGRIRVTAIRANEIALAIDEFGNTRQEVLMLKDPRKEKTP